MTIYIIIIAIFFLFVSRKLIARILRPFILLRDFGNTISSHNEYTLRFFAKLGGFGYEIIKPYYPVEGYPENFSKPNHDTNFAVKIDGRVYPCCGYTNYPNGFAFTFRKSYEIE